MANFIDRIFLLSQNGDGDVNTGKIFEKNMQIEAFTSNTGYKSH